MTVKDCTKDELIYIIDRLTLLDKYRLNTILHEVEYNRIKKKLAESERWSQISDSCRQKYIEILKKHEGKKVVDIPLSELKKAEQLLKDAEKADKEYTKLIKEVDAYGKKR